MRDLQQILHAERRAMPTTAAVWAHIDMLPHVHERDAQQRRLMQNSTRCVAPAVPVLPEGNEGEAGRGAEQGFYSASAARLMLGWAVDRRFVYNVTYLKFIYVRPSTPHTLEYMS